MCIFAAEKELNKYHVEILSDIYCRGIDYESI